MMKGQKTMLTCLNCQKDYPKPNDRGKRLYCIECAAKRRQQLNKQTYYNRKNLLATASSIGE
jgi:hypothetical protein